ncbi:MAG TPA: aminopeptidase N [Pusillimonas sp.]|uniref:aminopeptidase N n=1 Tax=Pusillimonas sp. TaxID=3040095 RepID=UPI002CF65F11|nr:aminopeptidase N [Pusillimonas sp.]HUH86709.1 aminopeptidase N [Pusillimonas sp.]
MRTDTAPSISRHDYQPYPYRLPQVSLQFELNENLTRVCASFEIESTEKVLPPLILDGQELSLISVKIDGVVLEAGDYQLNAETLTLFPAQPRCSVEIISECRPVDNSALMGLYVSGSSLFTQCEAEGFRRITWFPDRPDVMSRYTVTLRADKAAYPQLLSNGNLVASSDLDGNRHEAVWEDPHPKPSYLFALVAGDFDCLERRIQTGDGREALLQIYSDKGAKEKTHWALDCLHRSVQWDEQRFGLLLDLDRFMVVAARDFNMGAMENKGLNIFNSSYVLADPDTATDAAYHGIESVIGHEYFHNWTGNRVTCRDWFQLSLKEGLTVFRDQEFSADMMAQGLSAEAASSARAVKRIDDVTALRIAQFPEDAGPMAHPIRPESYQEIANFYTATIYEKGAEVIRMQHTLLGEEAFQAGIKEYFGRHDGQAVTCDDFVDAMDSVYRQRNPGKSLDVFRRWYSQAGTPRVQVSLDYTPQTRSCRITLRQHCAPVGIEKLQSPPLQKQPLHIPFALGLLDRQGRPQTLHHEGRAVETVVLDLCAETQSWTFPDIAEPPVASLLRNFSAPVIVEYERDDAELALLARHDTDPFARWEAGQELASRQLLAMADGSTIALGGSASVLVQTWRALLQDPDISDAYRSQVLTLPATKVLLEKTDPVNPLAVAQAREALRAELGRELAELWLQTYQACVRAESDHYSPDAISSGRRALKNLALAYLAAGKHPEAQSMAEAQYENALNMTDRMGGLWALVSQGETTAATQALQHFYEQWQHDPLVIDRWFALQATAGHTRSDTVRALMLHPAFTLRNPNRARSLIFQFCLNNTLGVHRPEGYDFWAEQVLALDALNPEIAARLARAFDNWARYIPENRDAVQRALQRIQQHEPLSRNVAEIVSKALNL